MIRATFIAVTTIVFSAFFAGFIVFDRTNAQTVTVSPLPSTTVTPTMSTAPTMTPSPTGEVKAERTIPAGAPNTGRAE